MQNPNIFSSNPHSQTVNFLNQRSYGEDILWRQALEGEKYKGYEFHKQFPICQYTLAFICRELNLVIEVDGKSPYLKTESQQKKDDDLLRLGYHISRFPENEVVNALESVVDEIDYTIQSLVKKTTKLAN